jgi:hypothetical protein
MKMVDKKPLESKKWTAHLIAEFTWTSLLVLCILQAVDGWWMPVLVAMVLSKGFMEVVYLGKQGDVDRYLGIAKIAAGKSDEKPE